MRPEGARISGSPTSGASSAGATMRAMSRLGRPPAHAGTEGLGDGMTERPLSIAKAVVASSAGVTMRASSRARPAACMSSLNVFQRFERVLPTRQTVRRQL